MGVAGGILEMERKPADHMPSRIQMATAPNRCGGVQEEEPEPTGAVGQVPHTHTFPTHVLLSSSWRETVWLSYKGSHRPQTVTSFLHISKGPFPKQAGT